MLTQIPIPDGTTDFWPYATGVLLLTIVGGATTVGAVFWRLLSDKETQRTELREDLKTCTAELGKTTDALRGMNDVTERGRATVAEGLGKIEGKIDVLLDIIAPRSRGD